jgi:hypothetical protein
MTRYSRTMHLRSSYIRAIHLREMHDMVRHARSRLGRGLGMLKIKPVRL